MFDDWLSLLESFQQNSISDEFANNGTERLNECIGKSMRLTIYCDLCNGNNSLVVGCYSPTFRQTRMVIFKAILTVKSPQIWDLYSEWFLMFIQQFWHKVAIFFSVSVLGKFTRIEFGLNCCTSFSVVIVGCKLTGGVWDHLDTEEVEQVN